MTVTHPFWERMRRCNRIPWFVAVWRMWRNGVPVREAIRVYHYWVWHG